MAYLNVRDRRLETKIVYVGPPGAGKATNLEQLARRTSPHPSSAERSVTDDAGEIVALEWGAETAERFRDCRLFAHVVAPRGTVSAERTRALLRDVDGVVLVVDASSRAQDDNRAAAALLRDALASGKRDVPVVVQVNKTDSEDALPVDAVVASLAASSWPHVEAVAARGQGVVETIERALDGVLDALRAHTAEEDATSGIRTNGNPLLDALRQVLRETVAQHVAELEARFVAKLDGALEVAALRKTLADEGARTRSSVDALRAKVEAVQAKVDRLREEVRSEVVRVVEVQARADREHVATIAANLRRVVEQVAADVREAQKDAKKDDIRARFAAIDGALEALGRSLSEDVRDVVIAHVVGVEELVRSSGEGISDVQLRVTELTEELKKKDKKGWFG